MREPRRDTYEGKDPLVADPLPDDWNEAEMFLSRRLTAQEDGTEESRLLTAASCLD